MATATQTYDFLVIGGGSAGYAGARTAAELGLSVAVIDGAKELGGLCILRGCMPSKTLIESANRATTIRRAAEFGLRAGGLEVYPKEIIHRKRELIQEFADYRVEQLHSGKFDLIRGFARFVSPHEVEVLPAEGEPFPVHAKTVLIATGSDVSLPPMPGLQETGYLTSDDILECEG